MRTSVGSQTNLLNYNGRIALIIARARNRAYFFTLAARWLFSPESCERVWQVLHDCICPSRLDHKCEESESIQSVDILLPFRPEPLQADGLNWEMSPSGAFIANLFYGDNFRCLQLRSSTIKAAASKLPRDLSANSRRRAEPSRRPPSARRDRLPGGQARGGPAIYWTGDRLAGGTALFHNNLGETYRALGRMSEAIACYRRALELKPDYAEAYNNLGNPLQGQGHCDEALACWRRRWR